MSKRSDRISDLIPGRLAFLSASQEIINRLKKGKEGQNLIFVTSGLHHKYFPLTRDFGPVSLGVVHRFCVALSSRLSRSVNKKLVYCFEQSAAAQANACFILGSLLVLRFGFTAEQASEPFTRPSGPVSLRPFRDASSTDHPFPLLLEDCLRGLSKSVKLGWFDVENFDAGLYEYLENPENGDIHRVCPKFIAFKGPLAMNSVHRMRDEIALPPEHYADVLLQQGVSSVVRLNDADTYDAAKLKRAGISHYDLCFEDCTMPSEDIVERFLDICDAATGTVAVHCRAGLGRTGTLIALWMMKHAGFGAEEAIGWLRIVRPGSVIGPQQEYLKACERRRWRGNVLLPPDDLPSAPLPRRLRPAAASESRDAADIARQVTAGMCARGLAKAAAASSESRRDAVSPAGAGRGLRVSSSHIASSRAGCGQEALSKFARARGWCPEQEVEAQMDSETGCDSG
jgi:cell division cycle 14